MHQFVGVTARHGQAAGMSFLCLHAYMHGTGEGTAKSCTVQTWAVGWRTGVEGGVVGEGGGKCCPRALIGAGPCASCRPHSPIRCPPPISPLPPSPAPPPPRTPWCRLVEREVRLMCEGALAVAREVVAANAALHEGLSAQLQAEERLEGEALLVGGWVGGIRRQAAAPCHCDRGRRAAAPASLRRSGVVAAGRPAAGVACWAYCTCRHHGQQPSILRAVLSVPTHPPTPLPPPGHCCRAGSSRQQCRRPSVPLCCGGRSLPL